MGYGHLRPAHALAASLKTTVLPFDQPPLASAREVRLWRRARAIYEMMSRASETPLLGRAMRSGLDALTSIPHLYPYRDLSAPSGPTRMVEHLIRRGFGLGLVDHLRSSQSTLVTTFYAPALAADAAGWDRIVCVVTDTDINRVWVPRNGAQTRIHYCVPAEQTVRRLRAYGVREEHIHLTGFPLPERLVGGEDLVELRHNLAARLVRLDPAGRFRQQHREELSRFLGPLPGDQAGRPPLLVFAVGGAGAQLAIAKTFLPSLRELLLRGRLRLCLVAGTRHAAARNLRRWLDQYGLGHMCGSGIEILCESSFPAYLDRFNALLADADILWTKPSELTFFGALGIPLVFSWPLGIHERSNRRWAIHRGVGFKQESPHFAGLWLKEWLQEGTLAAAAWSGALRMPKRGAKAVTDLVRTLNPIAVTGTR